MNRKSPGKKKNITWKNRKREFYSHAIAYHNNRDLRDLFKLFLPMREEGFVWHPGGIDLASTENPFPNVNLEKYVDIEKCTLIYCDQGFVMRYQWHGDFFPHSGFSPYIVKGGKLIYKIERKEISLLESFPGLTYPYLDERIQSALDESGTKIRKNIRELQRKLFEEQKNLALIQEGLERIVSDDGFS